jgi:hypothetical protein
MNVNTKVKHKVKQTTQKQKTLPILPIYAWWICGAGITIGSILSFSERSVEGAGVAILSMAPLMLLLNMRLFPGFPIGPLTFMYLYHALGYAVGPLWQLYAFGYLDRLSPAGFVPAQWGGVLGLFMIALFFPRAFAWAEQAFAPGDKKAALEREPAKWANYALILIIAVFGSIAFGFITGAGNRLGGLTATIVASSLFSLTRPLQYPLFFFLGFQASQRKRSWLLIWLATWLMYSAFYFLDGGRGAAGYALIFSGIGFIYGGVSLRRVMILGLLVAIPFVPLSQIVLDYRNQVSGRVGTSIDARVDAFSSSLDQFGERQTDDPYTSTAAFARGITAGFVDGVFLLTPRVIPFAGFADIELIPYALTPKLINPNRPDLNDGNRLAIMYGRALPETTGSYMPTVGDGYRRFGWPGVAGLYALASVVFAIPLAISWSRRGQRHWMAFFIFLIFQSGSIWSVTLITLGTMALWIFLRAWIIVWLPAWILHLFNK